jgi:hypothetical protein
MIEVPIDTAGIIKYSSAFKVENPAKRKQRTKSTAAASNPDFTAGTTSIGTSASLSINPKHFVLMRSSALKPFLRNSGMSSALTGP